MLYEYMEPWDSSDECFPLITWRAFEQNLPKTSILSKIMISCKIEKFLSTNTPHQKIQPFPRGYEALRGILVCGRAPISFLGHFYLVDQNP